MRTMVPSPLCGGGRTSREALCGAVRPALQRQGVLRRGVFVRDGLRAQQQDGDSCRADIVYSYTFLRFWLVGFLYGFLCFISVVNQ